MHCDIIKLFNAFPVFTKTTVICAFFVIACILCSSSFPALLLQIIMSVWLTSPCPWSRTRYYETYIRYVHDVTTYLSSILLYAVFHGMLIKLHTCKQRLTLCFSVNRWILWENESAANRHWEEFFPTVATTVSFAADQYMSLYFWWFTARSESGGGLYPTIRREEPGVGDSDDERGSGEYYSGEEFHEDDIMLTRDRYCDDNSSCQLDLIWGKTESKTH